MTHYSSKIVFNDGSAITKVQLYSCESTKTIVSLWAFFCKVTIFFFFCITFSNSITSVSGAIKIPNDYLSDLPYYLSFPSGLS